MVLLPALGSAQAPSSPATNPQPRPGTQEPASTYDKIWNRFTQIYNDSSNPVVQRVLLSGRFHYDMATVNADQGDHEEANARRFRIGPRITLFRSLQFHGEVELDLERHDPVYSRFTDLYVMWTKNSRFVVTGGKQSVPFTLDGTTSSRELLTIDRSNLANNIWFTEEYMPGLSVSGRRAAWNYRAGVYSSGGRNRELGEFDGGAFTLGVLGYDFSKALGAKEALLTGNYVYQHPDRNNTFTRRFENIGSINFRYEANTWGLRTDLSIADGYEADAASDIAPQSNLWAIQAMTFYNVTTKFQIVGRYTHIDSTDASGIRLATYESRVVARQGDEYNELYLGANYYFYGHRLNLQSGVQWADMNDCTPTKAGEYSGASWTTGLRVGW
jgi:phosphate-selective porin OprO/OprP